MTRFIFARFTPLILSFLLVSGCASTTDYEIVQVPDSVNVTLQSEPPGFPVRFHRITDGPESFREVTTDSTIKLPAGLYRFGFLNSATGEIRQQGRVCLYGDEPDSLAA